MFSINIEHQNYYKCSLTSIAVHVNEKSNNSTAVGLGTSISLIFVVVAVLFVAYLKTRHKKLSTPNGTYKVILVIESY